MKKEINKYKAVLAVAVALALILPGVAVVANNVPEGGAQPTDIRANTQISIIPSAQIVEKGETFTVSVWGYPSEPINGISFDTLHFDETLIQANSPVVFDEFFAPAATLTSATLGLLVIDNVLGEIRVVFEGMMGSGGVNTSGSFVTISFTALSTLGVSPLNIEGVEITKEGPVVIPADINNGSVTIEEYIPSKPAMATSCGTRRPRSKAACSASMAT